MEGYVFSISVSYSLYPFDEISKWKPKSPCRANAVYNVNHGVSHTKVCYGAHEILFCY